MAEYDYFSGWFFSTRRSSQMWLAAAAQILIKKDTTHVPNNKMFHAYAEYSFYQYQTNDPNSGWVNYDDRNVTIYKLLSDGTYGESEIINIYNSAASLKGTTIVEDLGWFGYSENVTSRLFNCRWNSNNGTIYSNDVSATYTMPADPSVIYPKTNWIIAQGDNLTSSEYPKYDYRLWNDGQLEYTITHSYSGKNGEQGSGWYARYYVTDSFTYPCVDNSTWDDQLPKYKKNTVPSTGNYNICINNGNNDTSNVRVYYIDQTGINNGTCTVRIWGLQGSENKYAPPRVITNTFCGQCGNLSQFK